MTIKLVELVHHQPILNLISIRAIKPDEVLFVGTREEHDTVKHLQRLMAQDIQILLQLSLPLLQ